MAEAANCVLTYPLQQMRVKYFMSLHVDLIGDQFGSCDKKIEGSASLFYGPLKYSPPSFAQAT